MSASLHLPKGLPRLMYRMAIVGVVLGLAACTLPPMEAGNLPPPSKLSSLVSGKSTTADVRAALGEPRGFGAAHYRPDLPQHTVWYYEKLQTKGDQVGVSILLVMFRKDQYDGYLWFKGKQLLTGLEP